MHLKPGMNARLVLTDGTTVAGVAERSGQWGVHRLRDVQIFTRLDPERVQGFLLVPDRHVLFAQITPTNTPPTEG